MAKCLLRWTIKSYEIQVGRLQQHIRPPSALWSNNRAKAGDMYQHEWIKLPPPPPTHSPLLSHSTPPPGDGFSFYGSASKEDSHDKSCFPAAVLESVASHCGSLAHMNTSPSVWLCVQYKLHCVFRTFHVVGTVFKSLSGGILVMSCSHQKSPEKSKPKYNVSVLVWCSSFSPCDFHKVKGPRMWRQTHICAKIGSLRFDNLTKWTGAV